MFSVTVVEWVLLPLFPVMVSVRPVTVLAFRRTLIVSVEEPGLPAGFGLKLALVRFGRFDTLRFTAELPVTCVMFTV
jgi:hypothetical protein